MTKLGEDAAKEKLKTVEDPAFGRDVISHRIVKKVEVDGDRATVRVEIPTPAYPKRDRDELSRRIEAALKEEGASAVEVHQDVTTAYQPPPSDKALLPGVKNIIAVAAGKGGVGKSTVAANLALALQRHGASVGLLDADVFGPSMPQMLGPAQQHAATSQDPNQGQKITPAVHHGLKVISVGFFVNKDEAVVWRGPMVHNILQQFLSQVVWGDLDYLICDLPPGTGDVQLSLSQLIPLSGSVMVTTPQEVSVNDVVKGIAMFEKVEIPVFGVVENMSYYACPACGHHDEIFARGGGKRLANEANVQFFGELPIDARIRFGGDTGVPIMASAPDSENAQQFMEVASKVAIAAADRVLQMPVRSPRLAVIR